MISNLKQKKDKNLVLQKNRQKIETYITRTEQNNSNIQIFCKTKFRSSL